METIEERVAGEKRMTVQKDKFGFAKSSRFSPPKITNHVVAYEQSLSDFDRVLLRPKRNAMGGSSPRFEYYSSRRKQGALPSAHSYNNHALSTNKG